MVAIAKSPCDEGVIAGTRAADTAPCPPNVGRWVLAATILGSSMAFIDGTVVNVALPTLQAELGASRSSVQWIVQAYALVLAALILVGGSLGDRLGRRRVFVIGVVVFTLASIACGLAGSVALLIVARAAQGLGGALLVPGSLAIISATFGDDDERGRAIGTWSGFTAITSAIGPVLGGWLVENASWRWVFWINLPMAAIVLAIAHWRLPESRDDEAPGGLAGIDWTGAALATVALGGLVYGFTDAPNRGWSAPAVVGSLLVGAAALIAFLVVEARGRAPMMPLGLFRSRTFAGANALTFLLYAALGGALFFVPFNLIQVQGYGSTAAGAALLPMILLMFVLSRWAGGLIGRFGAKLPLIVGPTIAAIGFALFARPGVGGSYWATYFPAVVVLGLGMAVTVAPLTTAVMGAVEPRHSGVASGINNAVSRAAGVLAIALFGIVVAGAFASGLDDRLARLDLPAPDLAAIAAQQDRLADAAAPETLPARQRAAVDAAVDAAYVDGFRRVMLVSAALALLSALVAAAAVDGRAASRHAAPSAATA